MTASKHISTNPNNENILLIGDIRKAFLDTDFDELANCYLCASIPQAIEALKNNSYSVIAIVLYGFQTKLNQSLRTLRDNSSAKIILLAQMYEEPIAIRFASSSYNDKPLVDDYTICPISSYSELRRMYCEKDTPAVLPVIPSTSSDKPSEQVTAETQYSILNTQNDLSTRIRYLEKLATEDDLTGLKNRRYIMEFTRQIIEYAKEENGRVTLLIYDIDDFKKYNDLYGHLTGDQILKQAAHLMQRCCRPHDVVGRIGGDEFAVVFWDDPSLLKSVIEQSKKSDRRSIDSDHPPEAMLIAKRFIHELENNPTHIPNKAGLGPEGIGTLTISGGLASYPRDGKSVQELFEQADNALLEAKKSGKNRIYLVGRPEIS